MVDALVEMVVDAKVRVAAGEDTSLFFSISFDATISISSISRSCVAVIASILFDHKLPTDVR